MHVMSRQVLDAASCNPLRSHHVCHLFKGSTLSARCIRQHQQRCCQRRPTRASYWSSRMLALQAVATQSKAGPRQLMNPSNMLNWKVVDQQQQQLLGVVQEVIQPQEALGGTCPVLRIEAIKPAHPGVDSGAHEQHLIPWVPSIVQRIHVSTRTVVIAPPPGLLELGRQQQLLDTLRPELVAYGEPAAGSMAARLGQQYMPTKRQLVAAGREDLVKRIISAGGFIHVAHLLGLRAKRKPEGYWGESENLDRELSLFVAGMWTCLNNASSDEPYYYNQVTGRTQWELPQSPQRIPIDDAGTFLFAEDDADRVMPSRSAVLAAGRFDLHHGIMYQGGYQATAEALDRPHTWPRHKRFQTAAQLAREVRAFNKEQELPADMIPAASRLRAADRHDLLKEIQRYGGALALAPQVGMTTQRGSGYASMPSVTRELMKFVELSHVDSNVPRRSWHMPTQHQLSQAGRHDLVYALRKIGQGRAAQAADLKQNPRGRPSLPSLKAETRASC